MLTLNAISVTAHHKQVLQNVSLTCTPGQIQALMGPNGSGKSTLVHTIMGHPAYQLTHGTIHLDTIDISTLSIDKRARAGIFVAFQYPQEIPGVPVLTFLREAYRALTGQERALSDFTSYVTSLLEHIGLDASFLYREVHTHFSGGEKKKFELLQLLLFKPRIALLDEIDSGLDIDAIKTIASALAYACAENPALSVMLITHYNRILKHIEPHYVHILCQGNIIASGDKNLAYELETTGYEAYHDKQ